MVPLPNAYCPPPLRLRMRLKAFSSNTSTGEDTTEDTTSARMPGPSTGPCEAGREAVDGTLLDTLLDTLLLAVPVPTTLRLRLHLAVLTHSLRRSTMLSTWWSASEMYRMTLSLLSLGSGEPHGHELVSSSEACGMR